MTPCVISFIVGVLCSWPFGANANQPFTSAQIQQAQDEAKSDGTRSWPAGWGDGL